MILKLTRGSAATSGLIAVYTDDVSFPYYGLHKPTELEQLRIITNSDAEIDITIVIGQYSYNVLRANLWIEGVQQSARTLDQIKDALSLLFLDSIGLWGSAGTINPTTPYLPYRLNAVTFADSSAFQSVAPAGDNFKWEIGVKEVSASYENNGVITKKIIIGNSQAVVSAYNVVSLVIDLLNRRFDINAGKSGAIFNAAGSTNIGDTQSLGNSTVINIEDVSQVVSFVNTIAIRMGNIVSGSASALLDVGSTTQGVIFPRMTTVQKNAIPAPVPGMFIFDTDLQKYCHYSSTGWKTITST